MQPVRRYKDLPLDFSIHPDTGDLVFLKDEEAVKRSVKNIVLSNVYERHFDDAFGCSILDSLFDPLSYFEALNIQSAIEAAIRYYEPRVNLLEVIVDPNEDQNGYNITIKFQVINQLAPVTTIEMFLERAR